MADVRALLKAKRQEVRITHPLASYDRNGQLKCMTCGTLVKHASAWEGHLGSKIHRTNIAQLKGGEKIREEQISKDGKNRLQQLQEEQLTVGKRKAGVQDSGSESDEGDVKRWKVSEAMSKGFPADFFSDPSRAPLSPPSDKEEDDEEPQMPQIPQPKAAIDLEYERFQRELLNGPDFREAYERATVIVEPELVSETMDGIPSQDAPPDSELSQKLTEENSRRLKQQEEKELIMDRLMDEEIAQEEADMKVSVMKRRLEALKKKREVAKASKAKVGS